ncbi:MAG: DUF1501 domain-containing protein, partial [Planctomycetaceae bacterium]
MNQFHRRGFLCRSMQVGIGVGFSGWMANLAAAAEQQDKPKRSCIVLWMAGGPSQTDTFDLKPGHANGGPFKTIATETSGIEIGEHLPKFARWTHKSAIIRSMSTREGDHGRATQHLRTGYLPQGSIQFPSLGSIVAFERQELRSDLPNYVSIAPRGIFAPGRPAAGFLGPQFAPLVVGKDRGEDQEESLLRVENLQRPRKVTDEQSRQRLDLLRSMEREFLDQHPGLTAKSHVNAYERAVRLMSPDAAKAFQLDDEPAALRDTYGRTRFGQGCLLARRLIERDVPYVEVSLGGWDTHDNNFNQTKNLCATLDPAWSALLSDLESRDLLDSTLVVWMGEFGRTPVINPQVGRDHYPKAWSVVLSGGGVRGGQVVGRTSADGLTVEDRPVAVPDLLATVCLSLGLDPSKQNMSNVER